MRRKGESRQGRRSRYSYIVMRPGCRHPAVASTMIIDCCEVSALGWRLTDALSPSPWTITQAGSLRTLSRRTYPLSVIHYCCLLSACPPHYWASLPRYLVRPPEADALRAAAPLAAHDLRGVCKLILHLFHAFVLPCPLALLQILNSHYLLPPSALSSKFAAFAWRVRAIRTSLCL